MVLILGLVLDTVNRLLFLDNYNKLFSFIFLKINKAKISLIKIEFLIFPSLPNKRYTLYTAKFTAIHL